MDKISNKKHSNISRTKMLEHIETKNKKIREFEETTPKIQISEQDAISRLDAIDNAIWDTILAFLGLERDSMDWNMEYIGEIADVIYDAMICMGLCPEYPFCENNQNGEDTWFINCKENK